MCPYDCDYGYKRVRYQRLVVRAFSFIQSLRYLHRYVHATYGALQWCACLPYIMMPHIPRSAFHFVNCPLDSWYYFVKLHSFTIRQYRILPCRFLQCIPHGKPPCVVLILPISFRAYKGLAPSGKKTPAQSFVLTKNSCIFGFFSVALQQVRSAQAGHTQAFGSMAGVVVNWTFYLVSTFVVYWKFCVPKFATLPTAGTSAETTHNL